MMNCFLRFWIVRDRMGKDKGISESAARKRTSWYIGLKNLHKSSTIQNDVSAKNIRHT